MRLTRPLVVLAALALALPLALAPASPASGQVYRQCSIVDGEVVCVDIGGDPGDPGGSGGGGGGPSAPPPDDYFYPIWTTIDTNDANGNPCFQVVQGGGQLWGDAYEDAEDAGGTPCPGGAPEETPQEEVTRRWRTQVVPPGPRAFITPGESVVGLPAYLEIQEPAVWFTTLESEVSNRTFEIRARADWWIDWGDDPGARDDYKDTQGVPYPGGPGEISHVFSDIAVYDITVEAVWSASYRIVAGDGTANIWVPVPRPLLTSYELEPFPVGEVQSIRVR